MAGDLPVRVQRTNLVVADLDRAFRVYRDILGFRLDFTLGHRPETLRTHDGRVGREIGMLNHDGHLIVLYCILQSS